MALRVLHCILIPSERMPTVLGCTLRNNLTPDKINVSRVEQLTSRFVGHQNLVGLNLARSQPLFRAVDRAELRFAKFMAVDDNPRGWTNLGTVQRTLNDHLPTHLVADPGHHGGCEQSQECPVSP